MFITASQLLDVSMFQTTDQVVEFGFIGFYQEKKSLAFLKHCSARVMKY